jgi:hypothetical protein
VAQKGGIGPEGPFVHKGRNGPWAAKRLQSSRRLVPIVKAGPKRERAPCGARDLGGDGGYFAKRLEASLHLMFSRKAFT